MSFGGWNGRDTKCGLLQQRREEADEEGLGARVRWKASRTAMMASEETCQTLAGKRR